MASKPDIEPPPATFRSEVWKHFGFPAETEEGVRKVNKEVTICRYCFSCIKYGSANTSNMATHLKRHHPHVLATKAAKPQPQSEPKASGQLSLQECFTQKLAKGSAQAQLISKHIGLFMACDLRPYSIVEAPTFKELIETLEPKYILPSRTDIIKNEFDE